jgi:hypothetical protein
MPLTGGELKKFYWKKYLTNYNKSPYYKTMRTDITLTLDEAKDILEGYFAEKNNLDVMETYVKITLDGYIVDTLLDDEPVRNKY